MTFPLEMTDAERRVKDAIHLHLEHLERYVREVTVLDMSTNEKSFFAEVILTEGNVVKEVEEAMLRLRSSLGDSDIQADVRVAAEWTLKSVEYGGLCYGESGSIRSAEYFNVELLAGNAHHVVRIEVSQSALEELNRVVNEPQSFEKTNALVCEILRQEVSRWLSYGGESRWNPVANSVVRLSHLPLPRTT